MERLCPACLRLVLAARALVSKVELYLNNM